MPINKESFLSAIKKRVYEKPKENIKAIGEIASNRIKAVKGNIQSRKNIDRIAEKNVAKKGTFGMPMEIKLAEKRKEKKRILKNYGL